VHQGEPAALVIVTATGTAGFRSDGIHVTRSRHLRPNPWASPLTPESPRVCTRWSRRTPAASKNQENQVPEFVRDEEVVGSNPATPTDCRPESSLAGIFVASVVAGTCSK
jgi:hypothetical protein